MNNLIQSWLEAQCDIIPGISRAVVLSHGKENHDLVQSAVWPTDLENVPEELLSAANQVAERGSSVIRTANAANDDGLGTSVIASPIGEGSDKMGVAAVEIETGSGSQAQTILKLMRWGAVWYNLLQNKNSETRSSSRLSTVVELLVNTLAQSQFRSAAANAATEIATRLQCERVSIGLLKKRHIKVHAVSHNAQIDRRSNLLRNIAAAMEEAIDQDATVCFPPIADVTPRVSFAQEILVEKNNGNAVCSTPLYCGETVVGALTLESGNDKGFDAKTLELLEGLGALLGPVLDLKFQNDKPFVLKAWDRLWKLPGAVFGLHYLIFKLSVVVLVIASYFLFIQTGEFKVRTPATLEAALKQYITAPQSGYIASSEVRVGEIVKAGQILAKMEDKDIKLEQVQLKGEYEQYIKERRASLLNREDRSLASIATEKLKQTEARMHLLEERLKRTRIVAPFAGVIVSGDLTQSLGRPLESGDQLFEIAPIDSYRIRLDVDERDIGEITMGDQGVLLLSSFPNQTMPFTVERLLPVSDAHDGNNYFHVEASLQQHNPLLRPGMKGIAKVQIEQRKLAWIWFHRLINWFRLQSWKWLG